MATHTDSTPFPQPFTPDELTVLGLFYAGVRARVLRAQYGIDPWAVIQRHRHLAREEFLRGSELAERAAARARAVAAAGRFA
jgi:hypothetical protein